MKPKTFFLKLCILMQILVLSSCIKKNNPPVINDKTFSIDENSPSETFIGQVIAIDDDSPQLSYSIVSGNTNNAFEISETDGKITINNTEAIDYETTSSFTLSIEVKDDKNKNAFANIIINLNNIGIPTNGLLLYLPFNENVNDLSVNNNNGIDYTSHNYVTGKKSKALDFNGTTDFIRLSNSINSQNGLSFSFWFITRGANGMENNGSIISKYSKIYDTRCFMIWSFDSYENRGDNRLAAAFYKYGYSSGIHDHAKSYMQPSELTVFPNPALWTITNPKRLILNSWTHCLVNLTNTTLQIWINGELCIEKTREYGEYNNSQDEPVFIGNNYDIGEGSNNHFNGILDELRIYKRELTNKEIKILFKE